MAPPSRFGWRTGRSDDGDQGYCKNKWFHCVGHLSSPVCLKNRTIAFLLKETDDGGYYSRVGEFFCSALLYDRQAALEKWLSLAIAALVIVEQRKVVEALGNIAMLGAQHLLPDRQGAFSKRLGIAIAALFAIKHRQVTEAGGDIRMLGA